MSSNSSLAKKELQEVGNLEILEAIQLLGQEAPPFLEDEVFRLALYEEMKQMKARAQRGNEMAHGFAEELTLYLSKIS